MKKRVLITINPGLIDGKRFPTIRSLVSNLDKCCDLLVAPVGQYDFKSKKVRAFRRLKYGHFEDLGLLTPNADLWIVYSDGYWLDARPLGFKRRADFFQRQVDLHQYHLDKSHVGVALNSPDVEVRTLKHWLGTIDCKAAHVIPTQNVSSLDEIFDRRRILGELVVKLSWGGAMMGTSRLASDADVISFADRIAASAPYLTVKDYCMQDYAPSDVEKRFWIAGRKVVGARLLYDRSLPWQKKGDEQGFLYDEKTAGYDRDRRIVEKMLKLSELNVGSIDFIGSKINELNGCGTVFTYFQRKELLLDFREQMVSSFKTLLFQL